MFVDLKNTGQRVPGAKLYSNQSLIHINNDSEQKNIV